MSDTPPVSLVCCDLMGAVAFDDSVVEKAFTEAIATQGIVPGTAAYARSMVQIDRARGCPPADVMHRVFSDDAARAQAAHLAFERSYRAMVDRFGIMAAPGAHDAVASLAAAGVRVCVITGFSRSVSRLVLDKIGLQWRVDLTLCQDDVPRGCPWPDLVLAAVIRLGIGDVRDVAVVGDTENVILCGRRAGAGITVGLCTGARTADRLRQAGATHLLDTIADLPALLAPASSEPAAHIDPSTGNSQTPGQQGVSAA